MCGIAGFIACKYFSSIEPVSVIRQMTDALMHRGPDDSGAWVDQNVGITLGHRRLAVLDLSPAGHQPMFSASGRYVLVFNGEIYNHLELRLELEKQNLVPETGWRGHSDTEILLECIAAWGIEVALEVTVGMFALALWDRQEKTLSLARDRMGEKPLYYGWQNGCFLFSSELKAMRVHPAFTGRIDSVAANLFFHLGYIPTPFSIYEDIRKLIPGTCLKLTQKDFSAGCLPDPVPYWSLEMVAQRGWDKPFQGDFIEAQEELERLMLQAVKLQSVADVPVGAFLSGGIDSSLVVALMQTATSSRVTTFSIGMPEERLNEAHHARKVAEHLGTDHVEHMIQPKEALAIIPRLPEIWDEPFADSSQIPTYLVCQLARRQATVALSGDGGDEFFCGYNQYILFEKFYKTRNLRLFPWDLMIKLLSPLLRTKKGELFSRRVEAVINAWKQPDGQKLNQYWMDMFRQVATPFADCIKAPVNRKIPVFPNVASAACLWDAAYYLPDDILVKVDRAAMAVSLETRAPFLDHRLTEFALSLPPEYKLEGGRGKRVLREVLFRYVPKPMVERPKMGFSIPLSSWLRSELRPWAEELLSRKDCLEELGLDAPGVHCLWQEHVTRHRNHTERIWNILSILLWKRF